MKKLILTLLFLTAFTGVAAGVVGQDCPPGAMCATSNGDEPVSNNSSTSNQTLEDPRVTLTQVSASCSTDKNGSVQLSKYYKMESFPPQHKVEFNGTIITSNPCQKLDYNVSKDGGVYTMNIYSEPKNGTCIECVGAIGYQVTFSATAEYFQLNVQHNGEDMESFAPPQKINEGGLVEEPQNSQDKSVRTGFLAAILEFLQGFF